MNYAPTIVRPGALSDLLRELAFERELEHDSCRELQPGQLVDHFRLVREIGRGGFGVVYEAQDTELGRLVAFKAVKTGPRLALRQDRLLREAEALAQLAHPNILTLYEMGRCESGPYLVFELLRGRSLSDALSQGQLPTAEALRICVEVARGLAHAHSRGVIHRDLTPGNLFLCDDDQVKILDFGLAHAFGRRRVDGGTPAFMAPEQWAGAPEDERTDVFALGVILYRLLSGELPFPDDGGKVFGEGKAPPVLEIGGMHTLGEIVKRMLEIDPVRRPRDGGEVLAELAPIQRELDGLDAGSAVQIRKRPVSRRRKTIAVTIGLGIVIGAGLAFGAVLLALREGKKAQVEEVSVRDQSAEVAAPLAQPQPADVEIRVEGTAGAQIVEPTSGRVVVATPGSFRWPLSRTEVELRAEKKGHRSSILRITPDRDQVVRLELETSPKKERPRTRFDPERIDNPFEAK